VNWRLHTVGDKVRTRLSRGDLSEAFHAGEGVEFSIVSSPAAAKATVVPCARGVRRDCPQREGASVMVLLSPLREVSRADVATSVEEASHSR